MTSPVFTLITPSIQRRSLVDCCRSIDAQSYTRWFHIVMIDRQILDVDQIDSIDHPQRLIVQCPVVHRDFGNSCRSLAWERAPEESWCLGIDDDNTLAHPNALRDIAGALEGIEEKWALFPIVRYGERFFNDPPGLQLTDTANVVARREIARWPGIPDYEADGIWVEALKARYPYRAFPEIEPIVTMENSNHGK